MSPNRSELKRHYHQLKVMAESAEKQHKRNDLMRAVAGFLCTVGHVEKFHSVIDMSLREGCGYADAFSADDAADCFRQMELVTCNLLLQPWRAAEFGRIKIWSMLFRSLSECLGRVDQLFELIGYERNGDELLLRSPPTADALLDVAFDFFAARIECTLMDSVRAQSDGVATGDVSWVDVYQQRVDLVGDVTDAARKLSARRPLTVVVPEGPACDARSVRPSFNLLSPTSPHRLDNDTSGRAASVKRNPVEVIYPSLHMRNYSPEPTSPTPSTAVAGSVRSAKQNDHYTSADRSTDIASGRWTPSAATTNNQHISTGGAAANNNTYRPYEIPTPDYDIDDRMALVNSSVQRSIAQLESLQCRVASERRSTAQMLKRCRDCPGCHMADLPCDTIICPYCQFYMKQPTSNSHSMHT